MSSKTAFWNKARSKGECLFTNARASFRKLVRRSEAIPVLFWRTFWVWPCFLEVCWHTERTVNIRKLHENSSAQKLVVWICSILQVCSYGEGIRHKSSLLPYVLYYVFLESGAWQLEGTLILSRLSGLTSWQRLFAFPCADNLLVLLFQPFIALFFIAILPFFLAAIHLGHSKNEPRPLHKDEVRELRYAPLYDLWCREEGSSTRSVSRMFVFLKDLRFLRTSLFLIKKKPSSLVILSIL